MKPSGAVGTNAGHGHAWKRPDGLKCRCGGPAFCEQCKCDKQYAEDQRSSGARFVNENHLKFLMERYAEELEKLALDIPVMADTRKRILEISGAMKLCVKIYR